MIVERLNEYLRRRILDENNQIIIISHNPYMYYKCEKVIGVYTSENESQIIDYNL